MANFCQLQFVNSLQKHPELRTFQDLQTIYSYLKSLEALAFLREPALRALCREVRYERHEANDILYYRGELSTCWYILLTGSVFIDGSMYLPRSSFGKRSAGSGRRANECLILEPSEMVVIDYPDVQLMRPGQRQSCTTMNLEKLLALEPDEVNIGVPRPRMHCDGTMDADQLPLELQPVQTVLHRSEVYLKSNRSSHSSDTSSAYSGSDTMQSVQSSLDDPEVDLSGLVESAVDSDEEDDLAESIDSLTVRDTVRECLEKYPQERTEDDIDVLLEFMQHLPAFTNMTMSVRRALCAVMVLAVVEKANTVVMNDGEELDSWSVIVNGHVEVELPTGCVQELHLGDSFGLTPTVEKLFHQGVMRTKADDCQFACVAQQDYYRILHQGEENTRRHEEDGEVVLVTEQRILDGGNRRGHIVLKGTPDRLMSQLVEENSIVDPTFVEDFLLTHRTFLKASVQVASQLLTWFNDPSLRDRVTRVVLLWVNNHFTDFEMDPEMMDFLEQFEAGLEREKMHGQLRLLNFACAAKARSRTVTLARSTRDEILHFSILGGYERGFGIFVSKVDKGSKAEEVGLKRGDQILEVNGQSFEHMSHAKALEVLRGTTHLSVTVKSNLLAFKEMLNTPENSPRSRTKKTSCEIARLQPDPKARLSTQLELADTVSTHQVDSSPSKGDKTKDERKGGFMTLGHKTRIKKALIKMNIIPKNINNECHLNNSDDSLYSSHLGSTGTQSPQHSSGTMYHSHSNPDLTALQTFFEQDVRNDYPEHVLKVYKSDQTCKYLLVHKETTAREVVMLSLREFGITDPSSNYSLCEVTVGEGGVIKQRRLPDQLQNLAERIGLNSRYYLKNNNTTETLVPDELAGELTRENLVHFLQLNSVEVAIQLTLEDFSIFRQIEPTEYIDDLFELKSKYGTPQLSQFIELVNREMFWVVSEIVAEHNPVRRMKIIKQFIKIARQCKECKNFNSMFAIVSGLGHGAVSRLRNTWDKLPTKYQKMFEDMQELMDPTRNMAKYRNLINSEHIQPPIIPFYPVVRKDLTFIHLGNDTLVEDLVNFEKLRMIAKEIRQLNNMCSAPYDLFTMLELGGAHPSAAMVSMNQLTMGGVNVATFKRRKKSTTVPNPKKMFEEAQMVRRVKAYLKQLKVISDEEQLHQMSLDCEQVMGTTAALASVQIRKRHPSPTLSTASSNSSTSEGKKSIGSGPKFGADSPQAVRKLLALSEQAKIRPHQPPRHHHSLSPTPSPNTTRRRPDRHGHGRSHSDTPSPSVLPVDLSAESSSVTSLNNLPLRKSQTSGSVTPSDSSSVSSLQVHQACETDSGSYPHCDTCNNHSSSPPSQRRTNTNGGSHSPPLPRMRPPPAVVYPLAQQVLSSGQVTLSHKIHVPPPPPPLSRDIPPRARKPPDYNTAAQIARHRQLARLARNNGHEAGGGGYYSSEAVTDPEDDDEEAQVSAV